MVCLTLGLVLVFFGGAFARSFCLVLGFGLLEQVLFDWRFVFVLGFTRIYTVWFFMVGFLCFNMLSCSMF